MQNILVIGGTRGLGAALVALYAGRPDTHVLATCRSHSAPTSRPSVNTTTWIPSIDLTVPSCAARLVAALSGDAGPAADAAITTVYVSAGYFATEDFSSQDPGSGPDWARELVMYTTSSIAPVFLVHSLAHAGHLAPGAKVVLVSSEAGSITLRHEQEGGGNFAHHGSKAALNMVGRQLSFDLRPRGIAVGIVHPSFMRTDMTAGVGFDKYWDAGGAITPDEAAAILARWVDEDLAMDKSGQFWAPRGVVDIGNWEAVMGPAQGDKERPTQLPW